MAAAAAAEAIASRRLYDSDYSPDIELRCCAIYAGVIATATSRLCTTALYHKNASNSFGILLILELMHGSSMASRTMCRTGESATQRKTLQPLHPFPSLS